MNLFERLAQTLQEVVDYEGSWEDKRDLVEDEVDGNILEEFLSWFDLDDEE